MTAKTTTKNLYIEGYKIEACLRNEDGLLQVTVSRVPAGKRTTFEHGESVKIKETAVGARDTRIVFEPPKMTDKDLSSIGSSGDGTVMARTDA